MAHALHAHGRGMGISLKPEHLKRYKDVAKIILVLNIVINDVKAEKRR
jgi:hypothetical protein